MVKKIDSEGIHRIANTEKTDRQADIVFIHGLGGGSHSTWRHGKEGKRKHFFWPEELGKEMPNCGIWSVGYPAGITEWGEQGMIVEMRAGNVSHAMATAGLGDRPLFFVCHSMGGLIVKSLIVGSQTLPDEDRKCITGMVRGIVFCGTPHRGTAFADAAAVLGKLFGGSQEHVKEMVKNSDRLDILHDEFIEWQNNNPVSVESYAESRELYRKRWFLLWQRLPLVVPRASANPGIAGHNVRDVDEDHLSLVKPSNREHVVYAGVKRFISDTPVAAPIKPKGNDELVEELTRGDWNVDNQYLMPPHFTGRASERRMLSEWLATDEAHPLFSLRALGGFGKSALVWHWLMNDVTPAAWPRVVWWGFYGSEDVRFDNFVTKTLAYLTDAEVKGTKPSVDDVRALVDELRQGGTLLVLDGFERELRVYGGLNAAYQEDEAETKESDRDCVSTLAETFLRDVATLPDIRSKVLLTTRLSPRVLETRGGQLLEGCLDKELDQMHPDDAVEYFRAQDIRGTPAEIKQACEHYGYHPLSLNLLAGWIVGDIQQPRDIAAASRLDVSGNLKQRKHHVLEAAYDSLAPDRRALLSRIACFRSPTEYEVLKKLAESAAESVATIGGDLRGLVARGLLHHDTKAGRFDLHPIVRRYAYDRLAAPDRTTAHEDLRDYFAAVPRSDKPTCLEDLNPVIELYHHTVRAGQYDEAWRLFYDRINKPTFYQFGAYQLCIDLLSVLLPDDAKNPPRLQNEDAQAWTLDALANAYSLNGQPKRAVPLFEESIRIVEQRKDKQSVAISLGNLAYMAQMPIGALLAAEANLRTSIEICREIKEDYDEGIGHAELGLLLAYRGAYTESEAGLATVLRPFEEQADVQLQGVAWAYRALCQLLRLRSNPRSTIRNSQPALESARRALELADETAHTRFPHEADYIRTHWLLGAAHCVSNQYDEAEHQLNEALEHCRGINMVYFEADILIDLARLRAATGVPEEARRLAEEALLITERSGYVMQGADAHLELAKLARDRGDKATALDHAQKARDLATCDGPPDYTYHAAYTEAGALLEELKA